MGRALDRRDLADPADMAEMGDLSPAVDFARSSDLPPTYKDLAEPTSQDLLQPADLAPACGHPGQPCCAGGLCSSGACMTGGNPAQTICVLGNCGGYAYACCDSAGNPVFNVYGYCESPYSCMSTGCR